MVDRSPPASTEERRLRASNGRAHLDERELLAAVREGSAGAFDVLYQRHRRAGRAFADRLVAGDPRIDAEDVVELAFVRCYSALRNGKGPVDTLQYYLFAAIRNGVWDLRQRRQKESLALDRWAVDEQAGAPGDDDGSAQVSGLRSHTVIGSAFRNLPERWRHVLWLTEVEGRGPSEVATLLGISPNSVSALAYRARVALRTAFVTANQSGPDRAWCRPFATRIAEYMSARRRSEADFGDVLDHLAECIPCRDLVRGVDAPDAALASLLPIGALTTARWATATGRAAQPVAPAANARSRDARARSFGLAGAVAVALLAMAVVGMAVVRDDGDRSAAPSQGPMGQASPPPSGAPPSPGSPTDPVPSERPTTTVDVPARDEDGPVASPVPSTSPAAAAEVPAPGTSDDEPADQASVVGAISGWVVTAGASQVSPGLPGVPVEIVGERTGRNHITVTSTDGRWGWSELPGDTYDVFVLVPVGFVPVGEESTRSRPGSVWRVHVGTIAVRADAPSTLVVRLIRRTPAGTPR
ncbi:MAG: RNA polymerase sigma factor [Aquihabitans sp.]